MIVSTPPTNSSELTSGERTYKTASFEGWAIITHITVKCELCYYLTAE